MINKHKSKDRFLTTGSKFLHDGLLIAHPPLLHKSFIFSKHCSAEMTILIIAKNFNLHNDITMVNFKPYRAL